MAVTVKHPFVSTVPDAADTSIVRPSNWNADHTISGLGTAAELNAGVANGVATLDAGGKVPASQIPLQGDLNYQGTWNATTNTPTLVSSTGTKGYYYVVDVAGTTNLNGITDWQIGDWAIFNGTVWQKVDNTDAVTSVNGQVGTVVLTTTNIAEGTNEYFTTARARQSVSAGTGISYDNSTGVITNSSPSLGGDVVGPASATDNAIARFDTTTGKLIQNSGVTLDDNANLVGVRSTQYSGAIPATQPIGTMWFDSTTDSLNFQQNAITQQIGEELFIYGKASAAINDSPLQIIYHTGTVGASGVITFAPTVAGITDENAIIGVATEPIALNGFGRVTAYGVVHGINTTGSAYGETWANDDVIWYNPVTGNPTKVKPVAPNIKFQIGLVINAGSGGSGSFQVLLHAGTQLGGTDSNVQLTSPTAAQLLTYSTVDGYWKNTSLTAGTGISVGAATSGVLTVTNSAPDQTVVLTGGTGISTSGTYPNFTITNTAPSSGGTVTSITAGTGLTGGTITSSGTIAIDSTVATLTGSQILTNKTISGATNTLTNIGNSSLTNSAITINGSPISLGGSVSVGTVTSVTGTSPVVSSGGTTPAISMPAATTSVSGYLTSTDWNTFNSKQPAGTYVTSVAATSPVTSTGGTTPTIAMPAATGSVNGYLTSTDWTTFNSKAPAVTYTTNYVPYGQGTTTPALSVDFQYNPTLKNLIAPQVRASNGIVVNSKTVAASFTIASGDSAMSAGPITVSSGVTVTVSSGSRWVVL